MEMTAPLSETGTLGTTGVMLAAPLIGFAFGWFLERGGLGSARKLAGQFYFSDLTVFKVMFSALVTAMLGAFWLEAFGLLDLNLVYLPETFVIPQALGGFVFGVGFLFAGLCPGTSCVAASTGRLDGIAVMGGMFFGIVAFNALFSSLAGLYESTSLGAITLMDVLGVSHGASVALVVAAALIGFRVAARIGESRP
jgi:hypothetical protein